MVDSSLRAVAPLIMSISIRSAAGPLWSRNSFDTSINAVRRFGDNSTSLVVISALVATVISPFQLIVALLKDGILTFPVSPVRNVAPA